MSIINIPLTICKLCLYLYFIVSLLPWALWEGFSLGAMSEICNRVNPKQATHTGGIKETLTSVWLQWIILLQEVILTLGIVNCLAMTKQVKMPHMDAVFSFKESVPPGEVILFEPGVPSPILSEPISKRDQNHWCLFMHANPLCCLLSQAWHDFPAWVGSTGVSDVLDQSGSLPLAAVVFAYLHGSSVLSCFKLADSLCQQRAMCPKP